MYEKQLVFLKVYAVLYGFFAVLGLIYYFTYLQDEHFTYYSLYQFAFLPIIIMIFPFKFYYTKPGYFNIIIIAIGIYLFVAFLVRYASPRMTLCGVVEVYTYSYIPALIGVLVYLLIVVDLRFKQLPKILLYGMSGIYLGFEIWYGIEEYIHRHIRMNMDFEAVIRSLMIWQIPTVLLIIYLLITALIDKKSPHLQKMTMT